MANPLRDVRDMLLEGHYGLVIENLITGSNSEFEEEKQSFIIKIV
jgi:hypothetical protein